MSRLDRILISKAVGDKWHNIEVIAENRRFTDHTPLILKEVSGNYGPIPFKFYNSWLLEKDFNDVISKAWTEFRLEGHHLKMYYLMKKMKFVKSELVKWDKLMRDQRDNIKRENIKIMKK